MISTENKPIKLTKTIINDLTKHKGSLLYSHHIKWFLIIKDFTYTETIITKKNFWWSRETKASNEYYITEADILIWNRNIKKWSSLTPTGLNLIFDIFIDEPPCVLRDNYLKDIKAPLESLGASFKTNTVNE